MPWADERQQMLGAGFSPEEVLNYEADQRKSMIQAGFAQHEVDAHFGTTPYDPSPIKQYFKDAWKGAFGDETAPTFKQAIEVGLQNSVPGMAYRGKMPDASLPEDTPYAQHLVSQAATLAGDLPVMIAGGIIGAAGGASVGGAGGAAAGSAVPVAGTVAGGVSGAAIGAGVGAAGGAFALPAGLRAVMVDAYTKGNIDSFSRFWEVLTGAVTEEFKGYATGVVTKGAGNIAKVAGAGAVTAGAAEVGTMVTAGAALEGKMPEPRDFADAALLVFGMHGAVKGAAKITDVFVKTGVTPAKIAEDAKSDPTIRTDLLSHDKEIPDAYKNLVELPRAEEATPKNDLALTSRDVATQEQGGGGEPPKPPEAPEAMKPPPPEEPKALPPPTDPWAIVRSKIDVGNHDPKEKLTLKKLYSYAVDDMTFLPGKDVSAVDSPYKMGRLVRGSQGRADHFLEYGTFDAELQRNGISFREVLDPVKDDLDKFRVYGVARRAVELGQTSIERATEIDAAKKAASDARANAAKIKEDIAANTGLLNTLKRNKLRRAASEWEAEAKQHDADAATLEKLRTTENPSGVDLDAAQEVVRQGNATYEPVMRGLVEYQNRVTAYLRDKGVLSKAGYEAMIEANKQFVPLYRLMDPSASDGVKAGRGLSAHNPIKRIKGSKRIIIDPLESVIKNTYAYIALADRNEVGRTLVDFVSNKREVSLLPNETGREPLISLALEDKSGRALPAYEAENAVNLEVRKQLEDMGVKSAPEDLVAIIRTNMVGDGKIAVFEDGKRTIYNVDPEIERLFKALDQETTNLLVRMLAVPARMLRAGATITPEFIARNLSRDFLTAFVNSKGLFTPLDTFGGLMHALKKDEMYQAWLRSGGANSAMVSLDRKYLQESVFKLNENTKFTETAWNVVKSPLGFLRIASELAENATRLGEFSKGVEGDPNASKRSLLDAGYASREVTLDFARMGSKMRALNMIAAFSNAQIQGLDRTIREAKDRPANFTLKAVAGITVPSVLLWLANKDDERYKETPRWERDMFWIIPTDSWREAKPDDVGPDYLFRTSQSGKREFNDGHVYRIPKPFETGLIFGSLPERALEAMANDNPHAMDDFAKSVYKMIVPNVVSTMTPTGLTPLMEAATNRSMFTDGPLVSQRMMQELPEYRYQPYTTELAKGASKLLGYIPPLKHSDQISPIVIENYVRGWTGGLGTQLLQIADKGLKEAGLLPDPVQPAKTLADVPGIRAFTVRYPSAQAQSIQDFYTKRTEFSQTLTTIKRRAQEGDFQAAIRETKIAPDMLMKLDGASEALSAQSKFIRDIYKNPDFSPTDKRQLIDTAYYQMISIAQFWNKQIDAAHEVAAEK